MAVSSEYMTHKAGNVLGLANGGKTATGTVPGGARVAAVTFKLGTIPPPGCPGWDTPVGAIPGFTLITILKQLISKS